MIRQITRIALRGVALVTVLGLGSSPAQATNYWKYSVVNGTWSNGNNWSGVSASGLDNAGAPPPARPSTSCSSTAWRTPSRTTSQPPRWVYCPSTWSN